MRTLRRKITRRVNKSVSDLLLRCPQCGGGVIVGYHGKNPDGSKMSLYSCLRCGYEEIRERCTAIK